MNSDDFVRLVLGNPINQRLLDRLPRTGLRDAWLVSGCLFQTCWNQLTGRPTDYGIKDYDIFYFDDRDTSWVAEDAQIKTALTAFGDIGADVEIRNQARVHLWYAQKFGVPYTPLLRATDGIDRFLAHACMVGLRPARQSGIDVYAPRGFDDIADLIIRPNSRQHFDRTTYQSKADRWRGKWPELTIMPAVDAS